MVQNENDKKYFFHHVDDRLMQTPYEERSTSIHSVSDSQMLVDTQREFCCFDQLKAIESFTFFSLNVKLTLFSPLSYLHDVTSQCWDLVILKTVDQVFLAIFREC